MNRLGTPTSLYLSHTDPSISSWLNLWRHTCIIIIYMYNQLQSNWNLMPAMISNAYPTQPWLWDLCTQQQLHVPHLFTVRCRHKHKKKHNNCMHVWLLLSCACINHIWNINTSVFTFSVSWQKYLAHQCLSHCHLEPPTCTCTKHICHKISGAQIMHILTHMYVCVLVELCVYIYCFFSSM